MRERFSKSNRGWRWFIVLVIITGLMIGLPAVLRPVTISKLKEQQTIATRVAVASGVAATAIASVPDDSTTPVADQIADVSKYLIIASVAILLEQFIVGISLYVGIAAFVIGFFAYIIYRFKRNKVFLHISSKMMVFTICISVLVPFGLGIDNCIDKVIHTDKMINKVIVVEAEEIDVNNQDNEGFLDTITGFFGNMIRKAKNVGDEAEKLLMNFIMAAAALIITICIVPFFTIILLWNATKWALSDFYRIFLEAKETN